MNYNQHKHIGLWLELALELEINNLHSLLSNTIQTGDIPNKWHY